MNKIIMMMIFWMITVIVCVNASTSYTWHVSDSGSRLWDGISTNKTGGFTYAGVHNSHIYTSLDGITWNALSNSSSRYWGQIATDETGQYAVAVGDATIISYTSDYGSTWHDITSNPCGGTNLIPSYVSNGTFLIAAYAGHLCKSTNYGVNWTSITSSPVMNWYYFSASKDLSHYYAFPFGGYVYHSTDGNTFSSIIGSPNTDYNGFAVSGDGDKCYADTGASHRNIWYAYNNCTTWVNVSGIPSGNYGWINTNYNGSQVMVLNNNDVLISDDYGHNFTQYNITPVGTEVVNGAADYDMTKLFITVYGYSIYYTGSAVNANNISDGMTAHYKLDTLGQSNDTLGAHNLQSAGTHALNPGIINYSIGNFTGTTGNYLRNCSFPAPTTANDYAINLWFNQPAGYFFSTGESHVIMTLGDSNGAKQDVVIQNGVKNNSFMIMTYGVETKYVDSCGLGKWCMLTINFNSTDKKAYFYVNGELKNISASYSSYSGGYNNYLQIGSLRPCGADYANQNLRSGMVDDIGLWGRMLNQSEMQNIYTYNLTYPYIIPESGPPPVNHAPNQSILYYPIEGTEFPLYDSQEFNISLNYTQSIDPDNDSVYYDIHFNNGVDIVMNETESNFTGVYNSSFFSTGYYAINITACDVFGLCNSSISYNISMCESVWNDISDTTCINGNYTRLYVDINFCSAGLGLPADNGSSVSCTISSDNVTGSSNLSFSDPLKDYINAWMIALFLLLFIAYMFRIGSMNNGPYKIFISVAGVLMIFEVIILYSIISVMHDYYQIIIIMRYLYYMFLVGGLVFIMIGIMELYNERKGNKGENEN